MESDKYLLSLDLSTTCTGYAVFNLKGELKDTGILKPKVKGVTKLKYPKQQLSKMISLAEQILDLVENLKPTAIVVEEIAGSRQRLGQKVLDGLHWIVCYYLMDRYPLEKIFFYDVTGNAGWRFHLKLKQTDEDKEWNKNAKKLNKKLPNGQKVPIRGPKHLACKYANYRFKLNLDCDERKTDADIADAVSMGDAFLKFRFTEI